MVYAETLVGRSYLNQSENGTFYVVLKVRRKLAATLQVDPAELLMRDKKNRGP